MSMTSSRPYMARALYEWILENDCTPYILADADRPGVSVPREYVKDGQIVLNISPVAVRALAIENHALSFDGRFGGESLTITVPMPALMAIYARENGQGMVFEVSEGETFAQAEDAVEEKPALSSVKASEPEESEEKAPAKPKKGGRPSLKVVK